MNDCHRIMNDKDFWLTLEFDMSERLSKSTNKEMRKYWIDGFILQFIMDTKTGVNVEGDIWVAIGNKQQATSQMPILSKNPAKISSSQNTKF